MKSPSTRQGEGDTPASPSLFPYFSRHWETRKWAFCCRREEIQNPDQLNCWRLGRICGYFFSWVLVVLILICDRRLILESSTVHTSRSFLLPTKKTEEPASCKDLTLNFPCWESKLSSPWHMGIKTSGPRTWRLACLLGKLSRNWGPHHFTSLFPSQS